MTTLREAAQQALELLQSVQDHKLLENAAKAEGHAYPWVLPARGGERPWNPLTDDGDALRLAVALWVEVRVFNGKAHAGKQSTFWCTELASDDPYAATRRAIVRAAAEIGRSMK